MLHPYKGKFVEGAGLFWHDTVHGILYSTVNVWYAEKKDTIQYLSKGTLPDGLNLEKGLILYFMN